MPKNDICSPKCATWPDCPCSIFLNDYLDECEKESKPSKKKEVEKCPYCNRPFDRCVCNNAESEHEFYK
jgi:hypothetical protein